MIIRDHHLSSSGQLVDFALEVGVAGDALPATPRAGDWGARFAILAPCQLAQQVTKLAFEIVFGLAPPETERRVPRDLEGPS